MDYKKIGDFICELRKSKDMTQKDLSDKLHITVQAVSKWERGLGCPDISLFKPLSKIFDVSINELMNGEFISEENVKEKADDAILSALNHSHGVVKQRNKQIALVIIGIILVLYGIHTYGFYNDYFITFYGGVYSIYDAIIIVLGILSGIAGIIISLTISKNKKRFIIAMILILLVIVGLNLYSYFSYDLGFIFGIYFNISNAIRFVIITLGVSTSVIGIMLGKNKLKIIIVVVIMMSLIFLTGYIIDELSFQNMKVSITNRHYDYSEILMEAKGIKNDTNEVIINDIIDGIKELQKQQRRVDQLDGKSFSLSDGMMFVNTHSTYLNMVALRDDYMKYKNHKDTIAIDIYYTMFNNSASDASYKFCYNLSKGNILFPKPAIVSCSLALQVYYELEHVNSIRIFEEVLDDIK